jgi:hypothetical protein
MASESTTSSQSRRRNPPSIGVLRRTKCMARSKGRGLAAKREAVRRGGPGHPPAAHDRGRRRRSNTVVNPIGDADNEAAVNLRDGADPQACILRLPIEGFEGGLPARRMGKLIFIWRGLGKDSPKARRRGPSRMGISARCLSSYARVLARHLDLLAPRRALL